MHKGHRKTKVGIVGCGKISSVYFEAGQKFDAIEIIACADLKLELARASAEKYRVPSASGVEELLADPQVEIVINLTIPAAHATVGIAALRAGKSVYNEKPLAVSRDDAREMLRIASERNLRIGCAPDTFLGGGLQTCRQLIDEGAIGEPLGASAFMLSPGVEAWHPSPDFYYQTGGGPLFDMGPYYLTALISMLGPVRRVTGSGRVSFAERTIATAARKGQKIKVEVPTHLASVIDFASGPIATLVTSFDVAATQFHNMEIYGSEGTLVVPDPNTFGGEIWLRARGETDWRSMPLTHIYSENSRGIGVADMADAIRSGRPHRANGEMAYHVLDIMHAVHEASIENRHIEVASTMKRPEPLPLNLAPGQVSVDAPR
jgi:predicted dehydrogenase